MRGSIFRIFPLLICLPLFSCDHIDAVGDKVNELKNVRQESIQGIEDFKLDEIMDGVNGGPAVQNLSQTGFQSFVAGSGRLNIVDFHADWCPPCKQLGPVLAQVVEENSHVVRLGKINVDHAKELAQQQGVSSIPDVRFYVDGNLVHRFVGGESKAALEKLVAQHTAGIIPTNDLAGQLNAGLDGMTGNRPAASPRQNVKADVKPIEEAMKPMSKDWLPPGLSPKK